MAHYPQWGSKEQLESNSAAWPEGLQVRWISKAPSAAWSREHPEGYRPPIGPMFYLPVLPGYLSCRMVCAMALDTSVYTPVTNSTPRVVSSEWLDTRLTCRQCDFCCRELNLTPRLAGLSCLLSADSAPSILSQETFMLIEVPLLCYSKRLDT